jgi:hypothetical protein
MNQDRGDSKSDRKCGQSGFGEFGARAAQDPGAAEF